MPQYIGFSTINANKPRSTNMTPGYQGGVGSITNPIIAGKKYRIVDERLVVQDLINALNIRQGEKVGQPDYGTTIWGYVFDPNIQDTQLALETEIRRIASQDPRLMVNYVNAYPQQNGILLEVEMSIVPFNQTELLSIFLDANTNSASVA
jgi:phage baseplate assembly protein W